MTTTGIGLTVTRAAYTDPEAQRLIAAALADLAVRYGGDGDATPVAPEDFVPPNGVFLLAWLDGAAVGCGAWRAHGENAEIKRMFTAAEARGRGVAKAVLGELEATAREAGLRRMILETGDRQPEAIALYEARGYTRIKDFGFYKNEPGVLSYGLEL